MSPVPAASILSLLNQSAASSAGILAYATGSQIDDSLVNVSYRQLLDTATEKATWLRAQEGFLPGGITLVHFKSHLDNLIWFWASVLAGSVPAMSTPLVNTTEGRRAHFKHLWNILDNPLVVTNRDLLSSDFALNELLRVIAVNENVDPAQNGTHADSTCAKVSSNGHVDSDTANQLEGVAAVMLTSGSSGHSKAGYHVASLVEMHLLAMYTKVNQVQIAAVEVLSNPLRFLQLITEYRISMTFAPDFFLAKLLAYLDKAPASDTSKIDLSPLRFLTSGGELNNVDTGFRVTEHLRKLGVECNNLIIPGFGMTEICAGCIFNRTFPVTEKKEMQEFGSLGTPVSSMEMRISPVDQRRKESLINEVGLLELRGPIVFSRYLNDPNATKQAFTDDGWFQTGDLGSIDSQGQLHLAGRLKELININSVKYFLYEIEDAIEAARIPGVKPFCVACFSYRETTTSPEIVFVVYEHEYASDDTEARVSALHAIIRTVVLVTSARPQVLPLPAGYLEKSTLDKLSRPKISKALNEGVYKKEEDLNASTLHTYRENTFEVPRDETEKKLLQLFPEALGIDIEMDINMPILDTGISSVLPHVLLG
ncbi:Thioesterase [Penicillium malachiteum]|uniref:Thioesterase n=1 Tax=Penicillium malachiteum TaxID=1324776 RepID=A0AAD6HRZ7_9EURO|nr:Thioesterase [Penicillium malachiteum]